MPDALTTAIEPLSAEEQEQLAVCESEISEGLNTFWEVGRALSQISANRLYREEYETFQIYCAERWHMTRQHAHRLIEATTVFENVPALQTERQARAIKHFEKDIQGVVWQIAEKTAPMVAGKPKISAGHLAAVGEVMSGILLAGGLDDGSGEIKPIGTLIDGAITEEFYERLQRQKEIVREKLSKQANGNNGAESPSERLTPQTATTIPPNGDAPAAHGKAAQPTSPEVRARLLLRLLQWWIVGEDKERMDRNTALHPAKFAIYHFCKTILGQEKHEETEMRQIGAPRPDTCDFAGLRCPADETSAVQEIVFTNTSTQRLTSQRLALCGGCQGIYEALNEEVKGVSA